MGDAKAERKMKNNDNKNPPCLLSQLKLLIHKGIFLKTQYLKKNLKVYASTLQLVQSLLTFQIGHHQSEEY